jgi:hypothetical protein
MSTMRPLPLLLAVLFLALASGRSWATPPLERRAKEAGYPAADCQYCHAFDTKHMEDKAREMGLSPMNCGACHRGSLPKSGKDLFNERGRWLLGEKARRHAKEVDVLWLKDYRVDASPRPPATPAP